MVKVAKGTDFEPIARLEDKVKLLVDLVSGLRAEQAKTVEENRRLSREVESLNAKLADVEGSATELSALRDEREQIRARVSEMLEQLEGLDL